MLIITNNPKIVDEIKFGEIVFKEESYIDILKESRKLIHMGYELLSHPLYGSIKPNETPYRTIVLRKNNVLDTNSLLLIEEAIMTATKFMTNKKTPLWTDRVLDDFQIIDLDIITHTLNRI